MTASLKDIEPSSLEEAVNFLVANIAEEDREYILENGDAFLHHGFGTNLRNSWGLWHNSKLAQYFKDTYGLGHADDMSGLIISGLVAQIQGQIHKVDEQVERYKKHWHKMKVDPLTQESYK